jgi:hypothetical protein
MGHAEVFPDCPAVRDQVNSDDHLGADHAQDLDHVQSDTDRRIA